MPRKEEQKRALWIAGNPDTRGAGDLGEKERVLKAPLLSITKQLQ